MPYGSGAASDARLAAIRRHLSAILPAEQLQRFWQEGFAAERQPTFRLNSLRLAVAAAGGGVGGSGASGDSDSDAGGSGGGGNGGGGGGSSGGGGGGHGGSAAVSGGDTGGGQSPGTTAAGGATPASAAAVVRRLLSGFGLPADTPVESCPYYPRAHLLPPAAAASVRVAQHAATLEPLQSGAAYFQSLSSMLPALALMASPQPPPGCDHGTATEGCAVHDGGGGGDAGADGGGGDGGGGGGLRVLDLCAAPGGKTALLAELMGNRGTLLAVDASWPRMQRLQYNLNRLVPDAPNGPQQTERRGAAAGPVGGATGGALWRRGCVAAAHTDGTTLQVDERGLPVLLLPRKTGAVRQHGHGNAFPPGRTAGVYDRVLVDAPCSGLGRLQLRRPASYSHWLADDGGGGGGGSGGDGGRHSARQQRLLASAVRLLRRGGSLVYSTCTVDPRENEMVVAWLLGCVGGLRVVEPHLPHPELLPPLHRPQQQPVTHSPPASASVTTAAAVAHPAAAAAALGPVPLRAALEAHRPGCTYAPILDGPAWTQASLERGAGVGRSGGARRPSAAEYGVYDMYGTSGGGGRGGEWLREELGRCVRVVPGPTYEGFFIAQLVKL